VEPAPLDLRAQRRFNPARNYKHYMVPALMVALPTIIGLLLTAQNITREYELGTLEQLNVTPMTKLQFIAGKLIPFWLLALVIFSIGLAIGKLVFGIPMRGNLLLVYLAAMVYLVVVLGLGLWISTLSDTQAAAFQLVLGTVIPSIFLSGYVFPLDSMPPFFYYVSHLLPATWLIDAPASTVVGPPVITSRTLFVAMTPSSHGSFNSSRHPLTPSGMG
jgi:ABC-2 type transport system permease protein